MNKTNKAVNTAVNPAVKTLNGSIGGFLGTMISKKDLAESVKNKNTEKVCGFTYRFKGLVLFKDKSIKIVERVILFTTAQTAGYLSVDKILSTTISDPQTA